MRVGLSMRVLSANTYAEQRDGLAQDWIVFIERLEYLYLNSKYSSQISMITSLICLLICSFLLEVGDCPTQVEQCGEGLQNARNTTEKKILDFSLIRKIPVLGVQRISIYKYLFRGLFTRNLKDTAEIFENHVASEHKVKLIEDKWKSLMTNNQIKS